jgi:hypothetical protein
MASIIPSLYIFRAHSSCTEEQVKEVFNALLEEDIVKNVSSKWAKDRNTEEDFVMFWINFKKTSKNLENLITRLQEDTAAKVDFKLEYDGRHYWKVILNVAREKPKAVIKPRIMERGEMRGGAI